MDLLDLTPDVSRIMVRDYDGDNWLLRTFAGIDDEGNPSCYCLGEGDVTLHISVSWFRWRMPTPEELL